VISVDLNTNTAIRTVTVTAGPVRLLPRQAEMLFVLANAYPDGVSGGEMARRIYGRGCIADDREVQRSLKRFAVALSARIAPLGFVVDGKGGIDGTWSLKDVEGNTTLSKYAAFPRRRQRASWQHKEEGKGEEPMIKRTRTVASLPRNAKSLRGFASMDAEKQRAIASKGGQSVPNEKRSFSQNRELAAAAGRKGGQNVSGENRSFSRNRELAAAAGRKGGIASAANRQDTGPVTS